MQITNFISIPILRPAGHRGFLCVHGQAGTLIFIFKPSHLHAPNISNIRVVQVSPPSLLRTLSMSQTKILGLTEGGW